MKYFVAACLVLALGCGALQLTAGDAAQVANDQSNIEKCKGEGREAGSYKAFEDCLRDAGLKE